MVRAGAAVRQRLVSVKMLIREEPREAQFRKQRGGADPRPRVADAAASRPAWRVLLDSADARQPRLELWRADGSDLLRRCARRRARHGTTYATTSTSPRRSWAGGVLKRATRWTSAADAVRPAAGVAGVHGDHPAAAGVAGGRRQLTGMCGARCESCCIALAAQTRIRFRPARPAPAPGRPASRGTAAPGSSGSMRWMDELRRAVSRRRPSTLRRGARAAHAANPR